MLTGETCVGLSCFVKEEAEMSACGAPAAPRQCALGQRGYLNDGRTFLEVAHALPEGEIPNALNIASGALHKPSRLTLAERCHRECAQRQRAQVGVLIAVLLYLCICGLNSCQLSPNVRP